MAFAPSPERYPHDAFISYSHAADGQLAPALQQGLQRLAKPWYRTRALRIFRDKTSLSASPALWSSIETALGQSRFFLLMASPEAAASKWVQQEVTWWLEHRSPETLLIVLTAGELVWDESRRDFDWKRTDVLPDLLAGRFPGEPLYVDLRWAKGSTQLSLQHSEFRSAVLDLAAPLHGRPKEDVDSEEVRQHRRTRRLAVSAIALLVVLTVASLIGGFIATQQRDLAEQRGRVALARQLAAQGQAQMDFTASGLERSLLLATASLQTADTLEGRIVWQRSMRLLPVRTLTGQLPDSDLDSKVAFVSDQGLVTAAAWDNRPCVWQFPADAAARCFGDSAAKGRTMLGAGGGMLIADGDDRGTSEIWDVKTGEMRLQVTHGASRARHFLNRNGDRLVGIGLAGNSVHARGAWLLDVEARQLVARLHDDEYLRGALFSADGTLLATVGGTVRVWRTGDGKELATLQHADDDPHAREHVAFLPAHDQIVAGREVFDLATGARVAFLQHDDVTAIATSPDGRWVATGGDYRDGRVRIWESGSWRLVQTLTHSGGVTTLAFSPDSRRLATASYEPVKEQHADVRVWHTDDGFTEVARMATPAPVRHLQYSADGVRLAAASDDGTVQAWRLDSVAAHSVSVPAAACALSADGRTAAVASPAHEVRILRVPDLSEIRRLQHADPVRQLSFSGDGQRLVTVTRTVDQAREAQRRLNEERTRRMFRLPDPVSANGEPRHFRHTLHTWNLATGEVAMLDHQPEPYALAVNRDGSMAATAESDDGRTVLLFDVRHDGPPRALAHPSGVIALTFAPQGDRLLTGDGGRFTVNSASSARAWDVASGEPVVRIPHSGSVVGLAASDDGRLAASADMDNQVIVWEVASGREVARLADTASAVLFNPDATHLVSASGATGIRVWDLASAQAVANLGHGEEAYARTDAVMQFSPGGEWLATARPDSTVRVWTVDDWQETARYEFSGSEIWVDALRVLPEQGVVAVCGNLGRFDPDDHMLNRSVEIWDWQTTAMIERACARLPRDLSETEWVRFMGSEPYRSVCPRRD